MKNLVKTNLTKTLFLKTFSLVALLLIGLPTQYASAQTLSEIAVFHRCYLKITSMRAKESDALTQQVKAGTKTAIAACMEVLKKANLTGGGGTTIANTGDVVAKSVLSTFHHLHNSWLENKEFPVFSWPGHNLDVKDLYDVSTPALYYTRALFGAGIKAQYAITTNDYLGAIRTNMNPAKGPHSTANLADFIFTNTFSFAPTGDLLGVQVKGAATVNFAAGLPRTYGLTSYNLNGTRGGGFIGTTPYFLLYPANFTSNQQYQTDGGVKMLRKWARGIFHDALCRPMPVVRESDVTSLVVPTSPIAFRQTSTCTKCHASQDRAAAVARGIHIIYLGQGDPSSVGTKMRGGNFPIFETPSQAAEAQWPSSPDANYFKRPTNGVFYMRDYNGNLINQAITSVADLGQKIAATDDFYICAAKRYYEYFMGIDVDTGDLGDPAHLPALGKKDLYHRKVVIDLGKSLKTHQNLQQLISDILSLDNYKKLDYGIRSE